MIGLVLRETSPELPTCADCLKWLHKDGKLVLHHGQRVPRARGTHPPCWKCPKSGPQNGRPAPEKELSSKNLQALAFYWQIKAGAPLPNDAIARRNCALIEMVLTQVRSQRSDVQGMLALLFAGRTTRN